MGPSWDDNVEVGEQFLIWRPIFEGKYDQVSLIIQRLCGRNKEFEKIRKTHFLSFLVDYDSVFQLIIEIEVILIKMSYGRPLND